MIAACALFAVEAALLTFAEGEVLLDSKAPDLLAARVPAVRAGQTVVTGSGRTELLLRRANFVRLAPRSRLDLPAGGMALLRLAGTAMFDLAAPAGVEVRCGEAAVTFSRSGVYRLDCGAAPTVAVRRGAATAAIGAERIRVRAGRTLTLRPGARPARPSAREADSFDLWSASREEAAARWRKSGKALSTASDTVLTDPADIERYLWGPRP